MSMLLAPVTIPNASPIQLGPPDSISAIRITNESAYSLSVAMNGQGGTYPVDAYCTDIIFTKQYPGWDGSITIKSMLVLTNIGLAPSSEVLITIFGKQEQVYGTYPVGLSRLQNIGNTVSTAGGTVANLVNDGNTAATQFIESTVSGDVGSAVSVTNDGIIAIGTTAHKGSITLKGPLSTDNGAFVTDGSGDITAVKNITSTGHVSLDTARITTDGNGNITAVKAITSTGAIQTTGNISTSAGDLTVSGTASLDNTAITTDGLGNLTTGSVFFTSAATDPKISSDASGNINFDFGGTRHLQVNTGGVTASNGTLTSLFFGLTAGSGNYGLYTNSLSRISTGTFTSSGGGTVVVNHNLGATPNFVLLNTENNPSTTTLGAGSLTSTQFTAAAFSTLTCRFMALRF